MQGVLEPRIFDDFCGFEEEEPRLLSLNVAIIGPGMEIEARRCHRPMIRRDAMHDGM